MSTKWQRLRLANRSDFSPLLFKYHLTSDGYELYMTDLTNVWSEHLSRQQILARADENAATIDPSEDEEQYRMLLQKIGDAFHNKKDTHVTLNHRSRTDALELTTSTKLPRPLGPLEWIVYLKREPQSSLAQYLLLPLIKAEADWESRQQNLIDQLKRKDWILGKLFDKLEAVGVDLSTIFPGVSGLRTGRKGATLTQAAKHIRGVAPFDEHAWLEEHKESTPDSDLAANLLAELFPTSEAVAQADSFHPPPDSWWHGLSTANPVTLPRREDVGRIEEPKPSPGGEMTDTASGTDTDDDEFERQETPPRFKRSKDTVANPPVMRRSPALEQKPKTSPSPSPRKSPAKASTGLGRIGGLKAAPKPTAPSPSPDPEPPVPSQPTHTSPTNGDETDTGSDSDSDLDARPAPRRPAPQAQPTSPAKPRTLGLGHIGGLKKQEPKQDSPGSTPSGSPAPEDDDDDDDDDNNSHIPQEKPSTKPRGLGTIGGKKKTPAPPTKSPDPQQSTDSLPSPAHSKQNPKPTRSKLGVIGGNKPSKQSASATASQPPSSTAPRPNSGADAETEDESDAAAGEGPPSKPKLQGSAVKSPSPEESKHQPGPSEPPASQPPSEPETEEQKADRKREELKRQLQAKAKAPAKKKRKF